MGWCMGARAHRCECACNGIIMSRTVFCTNLSSVPGLSSGPLADAASSHHLEAETRADPGHSHNRLLGREGGRDGGSWVCGCTSACRCECARKRIITSQYRAQTCPLCQDCPVNAGESACVSRRVITSQYCAQTCPLCQPVLWAPGHCRCSFSLSGAVLSQSAIREEGERDGVRTNARRRRYVSVCEQEINGAHKPVLCARSDFWAQT